MSNTSKGKILVIEGLDGSGKATQAFEICNRLICRGKKVMLVSFPDYDSDSSALVKMYLGGEFGSDPSDVNAYAASTFYAVDRFASYKTKWKEFYESGGIIICDRYSTSNAVHQCAKLPREEWKQYLDWLMDFEHRLMGIPAPDQVIFLSVDPEISQALMSERHKGDEGKKDIHEKNLKYLKDCQKSSRYCINYLGWDKVECMEYGRLLSVPEVTEKIMEVLQIDD